MAADGACWPSYTESVTLSQVYLVFSAKPLTMWGSEPLLWALSTSLTCVLALLRSETARSQGTRGSGLAAEQPYVAPPSPVQAAWGLTPPPSYPPLPAGEPAQLPEALPLPAIQGEGLALPGRLDRPPTLPGDQCGGAWAAAWASISLCLRDLHSGSFLSSLLGAQVCCCCHGVAWEKTPDLLAGTTPLRSRVC